ncbi:MAG: hypothetical protein COT39_03595 [Parcubacteria group bacterium CG08_land_8_20_14_0_20_48_21]|nr:MAG: hypothetical protein COT39_03595 [Parcubacteria group bacterium CG08_land_8_20_14_0_20_48_21]PIW79326.1 MAG: hypothetical protein COZ99_01930 [Parcubacteria group bacterium CG_4_8_14_3_um_filter_48_16]PIY77626.1 MAG: hypothetical protein COY83_04495 [Parcubacteria group bacterium CG_4_10_14_0_8_um_filter_48_154]PIZ77212.1 MAG: hypothetical protein COY03_03840 [bacterium CG_4_10_14_0_2_um_filter_48_144]PJC40164.1 MAG: hypothetical protein CO043_00770 [Parcubacteria group bacterium CG_4_9
MKHTAAIAKTEDLSKSTIMQLALCAGLAFYGIVFLWNFFERGIFALGINASVFLALCLWLFVWTLRKKGRYSRSDFAWIIPIALIMASYAFYDNLFLKMTNFLVLPISFVIFYNQAVLPDKKTKPWDFEFILKVIGRLFSFFKDIRVVCSSYVNLILPARKAKQRIAARILMGLILFFALAFTIVIPLLSAADTIFAEKMQHLYQLIKQFISPLCIYKLIALAVLSVVLAAVLRAWSRDFHYKEKEKQNTNIDTIVSGIVLGGILVLYILFLWVQVHRLWVGTLPFDFKETEDLVKSGFWQLLFLSLLNIAIYFFTYRKTVAQLQKLLGAFTVTSLLLLISAGYRMTMYVTYYGFSYEKFFASYAILYCAVVFIWLISRLMMKQRSDILKFLAFLFIWMYALVTIFPVEQTIMRTNIVLAQGDGARLRLFEMTMLSPDVLGLIRQYQQQGKLREPVGYLAREGEAKSKEEFDWNPWIERQEKVVEDKKWYELNVMNIHYLQ